MLTTLMIAAAAFAADPTPDAKSELGKLRGTWTMVAGHVNGKPVPGEQIKKNRITWDGETCLLVSPHQSTEPIKAKLTKLTPKGKGGEMEWKRESGPHSDVVMLAYYEWDGPDSYKIAFDPKGKQRPSSLEAKDGVIVHSWTRETK